LLDESTENISISEIVKLAGLSRMSFYRYYQTKDNILRPYIDVSSQEFIEELKRNPIKKNQTSLTP